MNISSWNEEIEEIKEISKTLKSRVGRNALSDAVSKLRKKIDDEKNRIHSKLEMKIIDGNSYMIPQCVKSTDTDRFTFKVEGDVLYLIDKRGNLDKDNSYHWWHYAWIPNGNKFTKLLVRTLGGDYHGDRYFAETFHYKHPADAFSYQNRRLASNNKTYKTNIEYILNDLGLATKNRSR